jgi:hypothetical protein
MDKNFGLLQEKVNPREWVLGSNSPIVRGGDENILGDWRPYLPTKERQSYRKGNKYVDTMGCVSFSAINCLEILYKYKYKKELNFSDRALAKLSNTTKWGNYLYKVADEAQNGLVSEKTWPYPYDGAEYTWEDYYDEIPSDVLKDREYNKASMEINHEWVEKKDFKEALRYGPIQVTCYAWYKGSDGLYHRLNGAKENHALTLIHEKEGEYRVMFDTYPDSEGEYIKKVAWDNIGNWGKLFSINHKNKPMEFKNNTLIQLVEGQGGFGLYLDGQLIIDDLDKIQASFIVRNGGDIQGKVASVRQDWWNEQKKVNLKGEEL